MKQLSAGLLVYRKVDNSAEVLIVHPGGPFWARKDLGSWSIPKGGYDDAEEPLAAARREFSEETSLQAPIGNEVDLGEVKLKSGKRIHVWAVEGDLDLTSFKSNTAEIEWPPKSGRKIEIPEADKAAWFSLGNAMEKLHPVQAELVKRLAEHLNLEIKESASSPEQSSLF